MYQVANPATALVEPATYTNPPHFEGDAVIVANEIVYIDTCDVDGDPTHCRVCRRGSSQTYIIPTTWIYGCRALPAPAWVLKGTD